MSIRRVVSCLSEAAPDHPKEFLRTLVITFLEDTSVKPSLTLDNPVFEKAIEIADREARRLTSRTAVLQFRSAQQIMRQMQKCSVTTPSSTVQRGR